VQLVSKISNLCGRDPPTSQSDRQTDRRHAISITVLCTRVHRAVKTHILTTAYIPCGAWVVCAHCSSQYSIAISRAQIWALHCTNLSRHH